MQKFYEIGTSDRDVIKANILRQIINRQAEALLVGKNFTMLEDIEALDIRLDIPNSLYFPTEEVAEGTKGRKQMVKWFNVQNPLKKYENGFVVTHETKARQQQGQQVRISMDHCSRGQAFGMDQEIFTVLASGSAGNTAAAATWNAAAADPAGDVATAIGKILDGTTILDTDIPNINVAYPAKQFAHLVKPQAIENIVTNIKRWMETDLSIHLYPTRQLTTTAIVSLKSYETMITATYIGQAVPQAFFETDSTGDNYTFHRYYKTMIVPETSGGTTNTRIQTITGVAS